MSKCKTITIESTQCIPETENWWFYFSDADDEPGHGNLSVARTNAVRSVAMAVMLTGFFCCNQKMAFPADQ